MTKNHIPKPQKFFNGFFHVLSTINVITYVNAFMHNMLLFLPIWHFWPIEVYMQSKFTLNGLINIFWIKNKPNKDIIWYDDYW